MENQTRLEDFIERYKSGLIPWDEELPPPELMTYAAESSPGRGLDLGCGYGRSSIFLARHGWHMDGVDFVPQAIKEAQKRAEDANLSSLVTFHLGSITDLGFLSGPYDFAVDIGCMHSLPEPELIAYRDGLLRLLRKGAVYLLFAHLSNEGEVGDSELRWIKENTLLRLFTPGFELLHVEHGVTQVEDKPPWKSAWYRFIRTIN